MKLIGMWLLTAGLLCCGISPDVLADTVYRWVDAQGRVSFSDQPPADKARMREGPQLIEVVPPPDQATSADTERRLQENRRWFEQRTKERKAEDARRAREQAQQAKAGQRGQQQCDRAQQQLEAAERNYEVQRRTWLKPATKNRLKEQLASRRDEVKRRCNA